MEMDLKVDEYLTGEKHQLGRHVTMLVIMLFTIIVVSTLAVQPANTAISPRSTFLAPRDGPGEILQRFYVISFGFLLLRRRLLSRHWRATRQARYMSLAARSKGRECICRLVTVLWEFE